MWDMLAPSSIAVASRILIAKRPVVTTSLGQRVLLLPSLCRGEHARRRARLVRVLEAALDRERAARVLRHRAPLLRKGRELRELLDAA